MKVIGFLGGKCSNKKCGWVNENGTRGCSDYRILNIDHKKGGGSQHRKSGIGFEALLKIVLKNKRKYQLLCCNCNWIKAYEKKEFKFRYKRETR